MKTLEVAIQARLDEKRKAQEEAIRREQERRAEIARLEFLAAELFGEWLSQEYDIDLEGIKVTALKSNHEDTFFLRLAVGDIGGRIEYERPTCLVTDGDKVKLDIIPTTNPAPFHATIPSRDGRAYVDYSNLIDALIYAIYGTSNPTD